MTDTRPQNCRNRLQEEGKTHPRSGCDIEWCGGVFGTPPRCHLGPITDDEKAVEYLKRVRNNVDELMTELSLISTENPDFKPQNIHLILGGVRVIHQQLIEVIGAPK